MFTQQAKGGLIPCSTSALFDFSPMQYGPCAPEIYHVLDELVDADCLAKVPVSGETWVLYRATDHGQRRVVELETTVDRRVLDALRNLRTWCDQRPSTQLLRDVYRDYPEFAVNSVLPHWVPNR